MKELKAWESAVSGAFAGGMFNLILFPADTVKSVMQTEEEFEASWKREREAQAIFSGIRSRRCMVKVVFRGLYAGCGITVARSIPSSAIIFLIFRWTCEILWIKYP